MVSASRRWMVCCLSSLSLSIVTASVSAAEPKDSPSSAAAGREIFLREWIPNDPRSHGGDGLGPVFNETSCVSCHNQGGVGGGGSEAKNVTVISAVRNMAAQAATFPQQAPTARSGRARPGPLTPAPSFNQQRNAPQPAVPQSAENVPQANPAQVAEDSRESQERKQLLQDLKALHPGLATARSVVLHRSGTDAKYTVWRDRVLGVDMNAIAPQFNRPLGPVAIPATPAGSGFFESLLAESKRQDLEERLPPAELQAEKVRGIIFRRLGAGRNQQQFQMPGVNNLSVAAIPTQRNSTALFGVGLIDSIPDTVLEAAAERKMEDFPEVSGRVARLKDGKIGRFGWKAQKANLYDFTMTACAVELGLHVPDHPQAGVPLQPDYVPAGFDLNRDECQNLVKFLRDLPAPTRRTEESAAVAHELKKGEQVFAKIGCAACHTAELGQVAGIYSDLLLHDLGSDLGDSGSYGVFQPQSSGSDAEDPLAGLLADSAPQTFGTFDGSPEVAALKTEEMLPAKMIGAGRQEWRTPPLWGVRDSAPYMHDGRAETIEQAVAFHGGEAQMSANRFFRLSHEERSALLNFMRSLVAPDAVASAK